jgi:uncharacterized spore protein YtfJ
VSTVHRISAIGFWVAWLLGVVVWSVGRSRDQGKGYRGGEAAGVEPIAFLVVACGEVVEGEVEGVLVVDRVFFVADLGDNRCTAKN